MPASNRAFLNTLFQAHDIDINCGPLFDRAPGPVTPGPHFDRAAGMLLGLAIGDALGNPLAATAPAERAERWGDVGPGDVGPSEVVPNHDVPVGVGSGATGSGGAQPGDVRDYVPNAHAGGARIGLPSDETQLAFWTLEDLVAANRFRPKRVADRWCEQPIYGSGTTVRDFVREAKSGVAWHRCSRKSSGAGPAARIAPLLLPHLASGSADLWSDVAIGAMLTHNDSAAISAALGVAALLHACLAFADAADKHAIVPAEGRPVPPAAWWTDIFTSAIAGVEAEPFYRARSLTAAEDGIGDWTGSLAERVATTVTHALATGLSVEEAAARWGSSAYALEAIPIALLILARHAGDPEAALLRAVNDAAAADTVGAIVGACAGALNGAGAWPARWTGGLIGRTGAADDGRVTALIDAARGRWGG